jgi:hypothetical protein
VAGDPHLQTGRNDASPTAELPSDPPPPQSNELSAEEVKLVEQLSKFRANASVTLILRRLGYSEATNPEHRIGVMELPSQAIIGMGCLRNLNPTKVELLRLTLETVGNTKVLPGALWVDYLPLVVPLRAALQSVGVFVSFYAPPSQEEAATMPFDVAL